jgi:hypothetical protein
MSTCRRRKRTTHVSALSNQHEHLNQPLLFLTKLCGAHRAWAAGDSGMQECGSAADGAGRQPAACASAHPDRGAGERGHPPQPAAAPDLLQKEEDRRHLLQRSRAHDAHGREALPAHPAGASSCSFSLGGTVGLYLWAIDVHMRPKKSKSCLINSWERILQAPPYGFFVWQRGGEFLFGPWMCMLGQAWVKRYLRYNWQRILQMPPYEMFVWRRSWIVFVGRRCACWAKHS